MDDAHRRNGTKARYGSIDFGEPLIRDEADFNRHIHYIHWNPVKDGYVALVSHLAVFELPLVCQTEVAASSLSGADFGE